MMYLDTGSSNVEHRLSQVYSILRTLQIETGAFSQLTRRYMSEEFNPKTPDREGVRWVLTPEDVF